MCYQRVTEKNWCGTSPGSWAPGWSSPRREVCPSRTPTGHCEETWCLPAAGHSLARIGSLVPGSDLVLDRLWCRGRRPLGTATCVASSSLPICPTLPARRHRVVTCFIIYGTHHHHHQHHHNHHHYHHRHQPTALLIFWGTNKTPVSQQGNCNGVGLKADVSLTKRKPRTQNQCHEVYVGAEMDAHHQLVHH